MNLSLQGVSDAVVPSPSTLRLGRLAGVTFSLHVLLLFFPPLPPHIDGSLWSYLLGYSAVILAAFALAPRSRWLTARWRHAPAGRRVKLAAGCAAGILTAGLAVRAASPELFIRWTREEGLFEPITLLTYLVASMALLTSARDLTGRDRRFIQFFGAGFILLALEEVDYLGIVGGLVGRIDGVYVGSPHDLINLAVAGSLSVPIFLLVLAVVGILFTAALRKGYLQPLRVIRTILSPAGLWLWAGAVVLGLAVLEDTHVWHPFGLPRMEELLELIGALLCLCFGLDVAARFAPDDDPGQVRMVTVREPATF